MRAWRTVIDLTKVRAWLPQASRTLLPFARGGRFADENLQQSDSAAVQLEPQQQLPNPLRSYFDDHTEGPGIWKWAHYFDIYHRHFQKFIGRDVGVMEIGIYSGGSLGMWREYFGDRCQVYGVDIEPACLTYESDRIHVLIGDQSDRQFWARTRTAVPRIDVLIDDGLHHPEHQIITLEEMLPHLSPGGVYLCEDILGAPNYFTSYVAGLSSRFYGGPFGVSATIESIHLYPMVTVIEKRSHRLGSLREEKHGTEWRPLPVGI